MGQRRVRHVIARDFFDDALIGLRLAADRQRDRFGLGGSAADEEVDWPSEARIVPARLRLVPDDGEIEAVGMAQDGRRFMLAAPTGERNFIALFLWTAEGEFDRILVDDLGAPGDTSAAVEQALYERRAAQLGVFTVEPIEVAPFSVEQNGTLFGLVAYEPDDESEALAWVEYQPGNAFALCWPWDGTYF